MSARPKQPLSQARLAANRANAQKGAGPKTPEGKARSAANSIHHGFAGSHFAVIRPEDPAEIDKFKADLVATYQPVNSQEMFAIESIAQKSMHRASRLESGLFTLSLNEASSRRNDKPLFTLEPDMIAATGTFTAIETVDITRSQNRNYGLAEGFRRITEKSGTFKVFLRRQAQAERRYRRAVEDLRQLMAMRDQLATLQSVCQQAPAHPDPLQAPHDLNPVQFPLKRPTDEPNNHRQRAETKPVISPVANFHEPDSSPKTPQPKAAG